MTLAKVLVWVCLSQIEVEADAHAHVHAYPDDMYHEGLCALEARPSSVPFPALKRP
jgi:hypothetical protein